jgi:hypothetical protein
MGWPRDSRKEENLQLFSPRRRTMKYCRAFLRNAICPLLLAQTPLKIPFSYRILAEVVNDVTVAADPYCPTFQRG